MNIKKLAEEYSKLNGTKYIYGIENGELIEFTFSQNDFYHLLGFPKFKNDVTIVKMIENGSYYKNEFYRQVLKGNILYDDIKIEIKHINSYQTNGNTIHFCDAVQNDKVKQVINGRFPYFTYDNMIMLLKSELVVLYDKSKARPWNKVQADKIFFKLLQPEDKNLNFFVRKDSVEPSDCPVSFFLEDQKDAYLKTWNSTDKIQVKAEIIYRAAYENSTHLIDFEIYWEKLRFCYSNNHHIDEFKAQLRLKDYFPKGVPITSKMVNEELIIKDMELENIIDELNRDEKKLDLHNWKRSYLSESDEDKKFAIAIEILENYDIDVEKDYFVLNDNDVEIIKLHNSELKTQITVIKNRVKKMKKFQSVLFELEKKEIIYVYSKFIPEVDTYDDNFFIELINKYEITHNNVNPKKVKEYFIKYCKNKVKR